jgi:hypothetical protein
MRPVTGNKAEAGGPILVMGLLHFWPRKSTEWSTYGPGDLSQLLRPAFAKAAKQEPLMRFTIDSRALTRASAIKPTSQVAYFLGALS